MNLPDRSEQRVKSGSEFERLRTTGAAGLRVYAAGQLLVARLSDGRWIDVSVLGSEPDGTHRLCPISRIDVGHPRTDDPRRLAQLAA